MAAQSPLELGQRDQQLIEIVYRLGEATVAQVLAELPNPPSYSTVRGMLSILVEKKILRRRQGGTRHFYRPAMAREIARRSAFHQLLRTFYNGEPAAALATLLELSTGQLTDDDFDRMKQLLEKARFVNH